MKKVIIHLYRTQDGEEESNVYQGRLRPVNGKTVVTFNDDEATHILKMTEEGIDWSKTMILKEKRMSSETSFLKSKKTSLNYFTPAGVIPLAINTRVYEYNANEKHEVHLAYTIEQEGVVMSDYDVRIVIEKDE